MLAEFGRVSEFCVYIYIYIYTHTYFAIGEKNIETILSSLQACFVIDTHQGILLSRVFVPSFIYFINLHKNNTSIVTQ